MRLDATVLRGGGPRCAFQLLLLTGLIGGLIGCGSTSGGPGGLDSGTAVDLPPDQGAALVTQLQAASTALGTSSPNATLAAQAGQAVLLSGTQVNEVSDFTAGLLAPSPARSSMLTSGAAMAVAFEIDLLNYPGTPSTQTLSGVLLIQGRTDFVLAVGPSPASSIPPGVGVLWSGGKEWVTVGGQESAQRVNVRGGCPQAGLLPVFVTGCSLADFDNAGFGLTGAQPVLSTGATGPSSASLIPRSMIGVSLTVDCSKGTVCGSGGLTVPGAPTAVTAVPHNGYATVTWTPPANNGGTAITGYTVSKIPGGQAVVVGPVTQANVTSLTNGTSYTFTVHAYNIKGNGPESAPSNAVTPAANLP
jgi:hypothetical protein